LTVSIFSTFSLRSMGESDTVVVVAVVVVGVVVEVVVAVVVVVVVVAVVVGVVVTWSSGSVVICSLMLTK